MELQPESESAAVSLSLLAAIETRANKPVSRRFDIGMLARFTCETRNASGGKYPASTIHSVLFGLLLQACAIDPNCPHFLDPKDAQFREMHNIIDHYFRELLADGSGGRS